MNPDRPRVPDAVPMGMEIEFWADELDLPLVHWQRLVLLRWFPDARPPESGEGA